MTLARAGVPLRPPVDISSCDEAEDIVAPPSKVRRECDASATHRPLDHPPRQHRARRPASHVQSTAKLMCHFQALLPAPRPPRNPSPPQRFRTCPTPDGGPNPHFLRSARAPVVLPCAAPPSPCCGAALDSLATETVAPATGAAPAGLGRADSGQEGEWLGANPGPRAPVPSRRKQFSPHRSPAPQWQALF